MKKIILALLLLCFTLPAYADVASYSVTLQEEDASPKDRLRKFRFPNDSLTRNNPGDYSYDGGLSVGDSRYLKLNQTTPQTTIGTFIFPQVNVGTGTNIQELTVFGDETLSDDTPNIELRDTDTNDAYMFHLETGAGGAPYNNFQLWRGTDTGTGFSVNPGTPLVYWDNSNNFHIKTGNLYNHNTLYTDLITTDKDDLQLNPASSVNIKGAYDLPAADGTATYLVKTDGAGTWGYVDPGTIGITDHSLLSNLTWSTAGHTIDTNIDMVGNDLLNVDQIIGNSTYIRIGDAGVTSRSLSANDDLLVTGKLEVDGISYFDGLSLFYSDIRMQSGVAVNLSNYGVYFDGELHGGITRRNDDGLIWYVYNVDGYQNRNIIICDYTFRAKDYDHDVLSPHPTHFWQSATNPDTDNTQWLGIRRYTTEGTIATPDKLHLAIATDSSNWADDTIDGVNGILTGISLTDGAPNPVLTALEGSIELASDLLFADGINLTLQEDITFTGATTENLIKFPDNLADALSLQEGTNKYMTFVTTNAGEKIELLKPLDISEDTIVNKGGYERYYTTGTGTEAISGDMGVQNTGSSFQSRIWRWAFPIPEVLHGRDVRLTAGTMWLLGGANDFINSHRLSVYNASDGTTTDIDVDLENYIGPSHSFSNLPYTINTDENEPVVFVEVITSHAGFVDGTLVFYGIQLSFDSD